ncbi:MAG: AMP-binding protein [Saprospiraceae bacterium]|nr:AMP-binding protein [Saprospiraceae bacterium]
MQPDNLLDHFLQWEEQTPDRIFLRQAYAGSWHTWTFAQAGEESRRLAQSMLEFGLVAGDKVAILAKNCAHWFMSDLAIMMGGFISVPIYPTLSSDHIEEILEHSDTKLVIIGKLDDYSTQRQGIPDHCIKIGVSMYGIEEDHHWESLLEVYEPLTDVYEWRKDELCTIIYTSGTTGKSKGVMHTMGDFEDTLRMIIKEMSLPMQPNLFSYLPLSHIAERVAVENYGIRVGATISFAESLEKFNANLVDTQPDLFVAVPRIWSKYREGVLTKMSQEKLDRLLKIPIVSSIVKKSIRKKLGLAKSRIFASGAAPISVELQTWFYRLGIDILQVYGMTEDCVYAHMNRPGKNRFGTVGTPLPGMEVKFDPQGEIRIKAPGVFKGYYKEPELTSAAFDVEGFLRTGDIGEYDSDGYLTITGRVKDQFKTDKGKYIAPAPIELKFQSNPIIDLACIVGTGIPQPICLIVLNETIDQSQKKSIKEKLVTLLEKINEGLEKHECVEKVVIMRDSWTVENELLTPTLKVKRNLIENKYRHRFGEWFVDQNVVVWE